MLRVFTLLAMLAALVFRPVAARTDALVLPVAERKTVLVINSYHWGFAWTDAQVSGIPAGAAQRRRAAGDLCP